MQTVRVRRVQTARQTGKSADATVRSGALWFLVAPLSLAGVQHMINRELASDEARMQSKPRLGHRLASGGHAPLQGPRCSWTRP